MKRCIHQYSGIGGQMDFIRGASLSPGGKFASSGWRGRAGAGNLQA
ncbi:acetyl-CoA hydrolase/transferase C-terminal domain-containing protein [Chitinophaga sp. GCM10012297]|uniref:Acetyl-CoA hydrolase/transferase C-terminal domain-containing protein n=1 Tax=Chitinophaga chungangae TaxID=2821488 RepID=A0ABS3YIQ6_9BACT|nr:acetyl-CoA hydrolase/transferase C-terminal domain-containing protein [Chitinophaga chungangae]MBO9154315.1 hypothetical protein [Chitinophaga chungangae]